MRIVFAGGRFTGPTKEHEKLLDLTFTQKGDAYRIAVFGKEFPHQCTDRDPLTAAEKVNALCRLYPEHINAFIVGDQPRTRTPNQVLAYIWHEFAGKVDHPDLDLTIVAGVGSIGAGKDEGGSLIEYQSIINRLNHTRFPSTNEYRMCWESVDFVGNLRGETSGSVVRQFACSHNYQCKQEVKQFKELLHSRVDHELARHTMKLISRRTQRWLQQSPKSSKPSLKACATLLPTTP